MGRGWGIMNMGKEVGAGGKRLLSTPPNAQGTPPADKEGEGGLPAVGAGRRCWKGPGARLLGR